MQIVQEKIRQIEILSQDPEFQRNSAAILFFPHPWWLFLCMGLFLLGYLFFRYYVLKSMSNFWVRQFWKIPLAGIFLLGEFLISYAFLGKPWLDFLRAVYAIT